MKILVGNVGSTSLKFKLYDMADEKVLCEAKIERIGSTDSAIYAYKNMQTGYAIKEDNRDIPSYGIGIRCFVADMIEREKGVIRSLEEIDAIGFKTVLSKGYYGVHELTEDVMAGMQKSLFVAPVHNAAYLEAIGQFKQMFPNTRMVGVFETAFHTTIPIERRVYSVPYEWYEQYSLAKMGYHGASHSYISKACVQYGKAERVISCHLGGSCSICAIENGKSVDSSFGFSLQTGVIHANRCGDVDPYIVPFLLSEGMPLDEILNGMSKRGGLLGLSGVSNDLREIENAADEGNARAKLAIDVFVYDIVKYIGSFFAELGGVDQLVFTGGIGENSARIRQMVCEKVQHMGILLDKGKNMSGKAGVISTPGSPTVITVIPANEELGVAQLTEDCLTKAE